jgi:peptidoglycan/LPS O-acetylase OafA/YrhL
MRVIEGGARPAGMFGTMRLALAMLVASFHAGMMIYDIPAGIASVVGFYIISGYTMTGLMERHYPAPLQQIWEFYWDRLLRLGPQYYFWLVVTGVAALTIGRYFDHFVLFPTSWNLALANILVVPIDLYMYFPAIYDHTLIPPAWSLATEIVFYVLFPFLISDRRLMLFAATAGVAVSFFAQTGLIDTDIYGYRLLSGTIEFFIIGHAIYLRDYRLGLGIVAGMAVCAVAAQLAGNMGSFMTKPVIAGWLIGAPLVFGLSFLRPRRWDTALGNASYGCYLAHWMPASMLYNHFGDFYYGIGVAIIGAVLGAAGHYLVEVPFTKYRRRIRRTHTQADIELAAHR